jgi:glycerol-1-phosphate dehydrogenase [NAD(P)+]
MIGLDRSMIDRALAGATQTRRLELGAGALARTGAIAAERFPDQPVVVISDGPAFAAAGGPVLAALEAAGVAVAARKIFPADPPLHPDYAHVIELRELLKGPAAPVPLAIGSGTINDLVKRASFEAGLPYIVVATAASMDGYTASGAALIRDGVKLTMECPAPEIVIADTDVLRAAPPAMTAAGYGDLLGKVTAGADWLLADALGIEPVIPAIWTMVQKPLPGLLADPARYRRGDAAIEQLFLGLVVTGLAIQATGSSRPASGSEHQFSHLWEMRGLEHAGRPVSHGFKVGLGALLVSSLYEQLLARDLTRIDVGAAVANWPSLTTIEAEIARTMTDPAIRTKALEETRAKHVPATAVRARLARLRDAWPELQARLRVQLRPTEALAALLAGAGCPVTPEEIGLTRTQLRESVRAARDIRRRYTVYDLATEAGLLDHLVANVFAPGGYWAPPVAGDEIMTDEIRGA